MREQPHQKKFQPLSCSGFYLWHRLQAEAPSPLFFPSSHMFSASTKGKNFLLLVGGICQEKFKGLSESGNESTSTFSSDFAFSPEWMRNSIMFQSEPPRDRQFFSHFAPCSTPSLVTQSRKREAFACLPSALQRFQSWPLLSSLPPLTTRYRLYAGWLLICSSTSHNSRFVMFRNRAP